MKHFDASPIKDMTRPLLNSSIVSVGRKMQVAQQLSIFNTIGEDLVALAADDLVANGLQPLFLGDRIIARENLQDQIDQVILGINKGCMKAGMVRLVGGNTEHEVEIYKNQIEITASATGAVDAELKLGRDCVREGDLIIAMPASGFHLAGFSLIFEILATQGLDLAESYDFNRSLGEVLLTPSEIYTLDCLALIKSQRDNLRIFSHITNGGLANNTARVIPDGLVAIYDRSTWSMPLEMKFLGDLASLSREELEQSWNVGVGMSAIVDPAVGDLVIRSLAARGMKAWIAGKVEKAREMGASRSYLVSDYRK